jgi:hypothetical protein
MLKLSQESRCLGGHATFVHRFPEIRQSQLLPSLRPISQSKIIVNRGGICADFQSMQEIGKRCVIILAVIVQDASVQGGGPQLGIEL